MATLPIMLLWIQISWLVVLVGAQLASTLDEIRGRSSNNARSKKIIGQSPMFGINNGDNH